jgi:hypothetical protein
LALTHGKTTCCSGHDDAAELDPSHPPVAQAPTIDAMNK